MVNRIPHNLFCFKNPCSTRVVGLSYHGVTSLCQHIGHCRFFSPEFRLDMYYSLDFDHSGGHQDRSYGNGRDSRDYGRYRDLSLPHCNRGRNGARIGGKVYDGPGYDQGQGTFKGDGASRNNPNVRPREGDWFCSDPACKNLNFARREFCNNCKKPRYASGGSPRRGHPGPPSPHRRFSGPPSDRSPGRSLSGFRSPPRGWGRCPREFRADGPAYLGHEGRFLDPPLHKNRPPYPEDGFDERNRFYRHMPPDRIHRDRGKNFLNDTKGYARYPPRLPAFPSRGQRAHRFRDRSRSPIRGAPPKDYPRDNYVERGLGVRGGTGRGAN